MNGSMFQIVGEVFRRNGVRPVLVGGYAAISLKVQRMTFDVDFIMTSEDCQRLEPDVLSLGYTVFNRRESFVQYTNAAPGWRDMDFLLSDRATVDKLVAAGSIVTIAGEAFTVPSALHLVAMKLHALAGNPARELKDLQDIVALMQRHGIDPSSDGVRGLFVKYGALSYHDRVVKLVGGRHDR